MMKTTATLAAAAASAALIAAPAAHAYVFDVCPSGVSGIASTVTSCPFADVVRDSYFEHPSVYVEAYSPVTQQFYAMTCNSNQTVELNYGRRLAVLCTGGNNAQVVFW